MTFFESRSSYDLIVYVVKGFSKEKDRNLFVGLSYLAIYPVILRSSGRFNIEITFNTFEFIIGTLGFIIDKLTLFLIKLHLFAIHSNLLLMH